MTQAGRAPTAASPATRWVRGVAVGCVALNAALLAGALAALVWAPGDYGYAETRRPADGSGGTTIVRLAPKGALDAAGVRPGDTVVSPLVPPPAAGERVTLRVRRGVTDGVGGVGREDEVVVTLQERLPRAREALISFAVFGWLFLAVGVTVALARPQEPATRLVLWLGSLMASGAALSTWQVAEEGRGMWLEPVMAHAYTAVAVLVGGAVLHLFLAFPTAKGPLRALGALGPDWMRRRGGGRALLYAPAAVTLPIPVEQGLDTLAFLLSGGLVLGGVVAVIHTHRHPPTPLARAQLKWIMWATGVFALAVAVGPVASSVAQSIFRVRLVVPVPLVFALGAVLPLAIAFAVVRYRLFDVSLVVRETITYVVLSAPLLAGFLALAFVGSQIVVEVLGRDTANPAVPALAALAMVALAQPLRTRLQEVLDALIYHERLARRRYLSEAADLLGRAQSPETVTAFLTDRTMERLGLMGAWLVVPPAGRAAAQVIGPAPGGVAPVDLAPLAVPLLERLREVEEPVVLTIYDLSASGVPMLHADGPVLASWYEAGARLAVPLRAGEAGEMGDGLTGMWLLGAAWSGELPEREEIDGLARVGRQAAVLLDLGRLANERVERALVEQDIQRARQIQRRLLREQLPQWPGWLEIAARLEVAREASGDFYDVYALAERRYAAEPVPLQIAVGDVQGKGIGAALVMGLAQVALRSAVGPGAADAAGAQTMVAARGGGVPREQIDAIVDRWGTGGSGAAIASPGATLRRVGAMLHETLGPRDFVACALAVVEPAFGGDGGGNGGRGGVTLRLSMAGQVRPMLCRGGAVTELAAPGECVPLGVLPAAEYLDVVVDLEPDDVVVFATDGLLEAPAGPAMNGGGPGARDGQGGMDGAVVQPPRAGEFFGFDRLEASAAFWAAHAASAEGVLEGIWSDVTEWCKGYPHHDDMTLLVVRVSARRLEAPHEAIPWEADAI